MNRKDAEHSRKRAPKSKLEGKGAEFDKAAQSTKARRSKTPAVVVEKARPTKSFAKTGKKKR